LKYGIIVHVFNNQILVTYDEKYTKLGTNPALKIHANFRVISKDFFS